MTKAKALKVMSDHSRGIIDTTLASKIAQAFDCKLSTLGIKAQKINELIPIYDEKISSIKGIPVYKLALELAQHIHGTRVYSGMNGMGSYADDITKKAIKLLK